MSSSSKVKVDDGHLSLWLRHTLLGCFGVEAKVKARNNKSRQVLGFSSFLRRRLNAEVASLLIFVLFLGAFLIFVAELFLVAVKVK